MRKIVRHSFYNRVSAAAGVNLLFLWFRFLYLFMTIMFRVVSLADHVEHLLLELFLHIV